MLEHQPHSTKFFTGEAEAEGSRYLSHHWGLSETHYYGWRAEIACSLDVFVNFFTFRFYFC
jgi:hypothetical protein